jgi:hypothetical protein
MWILQVSSSIKEESLTRTLRLYLLRLNAEHECLRLTLQNIEKKAIQVIRGTKASDDLQRYLGKTFKKIGRYEAKTGDVSEDISELARHSINTIRPGQLDTLLEGVKDYRRYIRQVIAEYAKQDTTINIYGRNNIVSTKEVNVDQSQGNKYNFSGSNIGMLNIENTMTNVTQNVGNIPNMDQSSRDELKQLMQQLNTALKNTPAEKADDAEAVANAAKELIDDISKDKPNKTTVQIKLSGLKAAAENIAKVLPSVLPIATQIVTFISKSFGFG